MRYAKGSWRKAETGTKLRKIRPERLDVLLKKGGRNEKRSDLVHGRTKSEKRGRDEMASFPETAGERARFEETRKGLETWGGEDPME